MTDKQQPELSDRDFVLEHGPVRPEHLGRLGPEQAERYLSEMLGLVATEGREGFLALSRRNPADWPEAFSSWHRLAFPKIRWHRLRRGRPVSSIVLVPQPGLSWLETWFANSQRAGLPTFPRQGRDGGEQ